MSNSRRDSLAFYLSGVAIGLSSASSAFILGFSVWMVPLIFSASAVVFAAIDAVRRRSAARAYTFRDSGTYTLTRDEAPGR